MLTRARVKRQISQGWIHTVAAREKRLSTEHLGKNAADGPDVNCLGILLEGQHDLGRTVPACGDILGHESTVLVVRVGRTCQSKVADLKGHMTISLCLETNSHRYLGNRQPHCSYLKVAVGVQEKVGWLEIAVENIRRVHALEGTKCLVDKVLAMVVAEVLGPDNSVHVCLHQLLDQVHLLECLETWGFDDIQN